MSRHQAFRNVQSTVSEHLYGDEDYYSDEAEEELSAEDKAAMEQGTADVRAALGVEASKVTTEQIQEALWHYYYDVDKSVTYLLTKFIAPPPPKAAKSAQKPHSGASAYSTTKSFLSALFKDMPWGNIPQERVTVFVEPQRPRGGLLGGSGAAPKLTKLQQLALARKKKVEQQSSEEQAEDTREKLGELSMKEAPSLKENRLSEGGGFSKRQKLSDTTAAGRLLQREPAATDAEKRPTAIQRRSHLRDSSGQALSSLDGAEERAPEAGSPSTPFQPLPRSAADEPSHGAEMAGPSDFAQTLFGSPAVEPEPPANKLFALPYMAYCPSLADAFSKPSPDDVVLAAQAKAGKKTATAAATKKKGGGADSVANDVKALKIDDAPLPKSKNFNVLHEFEKSKSKKTASFVVVGHVDAGKSTMMGRLLLDLKVVDQRTVDKLRKEAEKIGKSSFALAWVLDQRTEERARGVTIDIATNRFETESTVFTILDAPGHRDFIPNMIAGASQADFAILVIDASTGAFESGLKGQTREHSLLIRSMGVSRVIVAVNKLDTVDWSKERFDEITHQVTGFLTATGFQPKNISFVPVSGLHGDNLVNRSTNPAASWYQGPTIVEELESSEPTTRALNKPLRMTISEVFRTPQSSITVAGRIDAGSLQMGDALLVQPSGEKAYIKSVQLDEEPVDWAVAGQNVVLHLSNIDPIHVRAGDIICDPAQPIQCLDSFTLKALAFDFLMPMQVDVHRGRLHSAGTIESIPALLDKVTGAVTKKKPKIVKPAAVARLVIKLASKVPLEAGQRVVLRSGGETVAAGLLE
ncbi:HBS1-like protein [Coniochaeta hoffmannii]|uniref:Elongation factor 1 alpha-like protein n=1 Tax=Coniochaeta hoffmannii TaxID=91930 RepID=A0AA38RLM3_9PEZI|nr:HBS1-like protein [Coniochaeta hoffmannii]